MFIYIDLSLFIFVYSPRFAWGGRPHRRSFLVPDRGQVIYIHNCWFFLNMCACYLHLYFKKLRSHPQPGLSRALISPPPFGILPMSAFAVFSMLWHPKKHSIPLSPQTLENTAIYTVFFNFSMFQCCWPTQTYIQKINQKHCSVKNHVIYTFFGMKPVQNTVVFAMFSMLWHPRTFQNIAIYSVFSFLSVLPLPEAYQKNDPKFHFNTLLSSDTQKSSKKIANTT